MKEKFYCSYCGSPLEMASVDGKERQVCTNCREVFYENPLPVACVILPNREREVLLVKRAREPSKGMWCLPIGFAETGESIEEAALRELREETGVEGKVRQLIDVSSEYNPFYGDVLVVTFEAEKRGGEEIPGDDAAECRYFPILNLPRLAFDSQKRAIDRYLEVMRDIWDMRDSLERFVEKTIHNKIVYPPTLLSDELVSAVKGNINRILELWADDIRTNPSTPHYHPFTKERLHQMFEPVIRQFETWVKAEGDERKLKAFYNDFGRQQKALQIPAGELISMLSLLKKHIWMFIYAFGTWDKPVDIYRVFEFGERLVYFFDKSTYYTIMGYTSGNKDGSL